MWGEFRKELGDVSERRQHCNEQTNEIQNNAHLQQHHTLTVTMHCMREVERCSSRENVAVLSAQQCCQC